MSGLVSLNCPRCGKPLDGENNSRVFFCLPCATGFDLDGQGLVAYDLHAALPPRLPDGDAVYFPLWAIESRVSGADGSASASGSGSTRLSLVPALFIKNVNYFGDIGMFYTWRRVPLPLGPPAAYPVLPADRGLHAALAYPSVYFARDPDLGRAGGLRRAGWRHLRFTLLLVPFVRQQNEFVEPLLGWRYPSGALI